MVGGWLSTLYEEAIHPRDLMLASVGGLSDNASPLAWPLPVSAGILDLSRVGQVVLDEADTLLDDSFRDDVRHLLSRLPLPALSASVTPEQDHRPATSLALLGATMPRNIDSLMEGLVLVSGQSTAT